MSFEKIDIQIHFSTEFLNQFNKFDIVHVFQNIFSTKGCNRIPHSFYFTEKYRRMMQGIFENLFFAISSPNSRQMHKGLPEYSQKENHIPKNTFIFLSWLVYKEAMFNKIVLFMPF